MTERSLHHGVNLHILDVSEDQAVVVKQAEDINICTINQHVRHFCESRCEKMSVAILNAVGYS